MNPNADPSDLDLAGTSFLTVDHPEIVAYAAEVTRAAETDIDRAVALFLAVRDGLRYDPYDISTDPADYQAHAVLGGSQRWCVSKAVLLATLTRAVGIPTRLGFADVKNHLQSAKLAETMGSDLFAWHGFAVMWLDGAWRKASPAFNRELCERFGTRVLDFDGRSDALLHAHDEAGNRHMEYVHDRGVYQDLPFDEIMTTLAETYAFVFKSDQAEFDPEFHGDRP